MTKQDENKPRTQHRGHFRVVIAGGGVAGWEAAFALRELAAERVSVTVLTAAEELVSRPLSVGEPFNRSHAERYPAAALADQAGVELVHGELAEVDTAERVARTATGDELAYDALLVATGATMQHVHHHAIEFDDARADELLHGLVQDIEEGYTRSLAIVVPAPPPWPLPAYELALMASERAWDMQTELDITLLTPERTPLEAFGDEASRGVAELLATRRIELVTSAYCEIPESQHVVVHPGGRTLKCDRVIALPRLRGPALSGLPSDGGGFLPVDQYGCVRGVERVWAAGDATDTPIKQGGVAAQLADTAARSIAILCGAHLGARSFVPLVEGVLMTGGTPRYLRGRPAWPGTDGESVFSEVSRNALPPKIAAQYLGPELQRLSGASTSPAG